MGEAHLLVHKLNPLQGLPSDILNLMESKPVIFVALYELVKALPQGLKNKASLDCLLILDSLFMDEGFFKMNDIIFASASVPDILQNLDLNFSRRVVSLNSSNYFYSIV